MKSLQKIIQLSHDWTELYAIYPVSSFLGVYRDSVSGNSFVLSTEIDWFGRPQSAFDCALYAHWVFVAGNKCTLTPSQFNLVSLELIQYGIRIDVPFVF